MVLTILECGRDTTESARETATPSSCMYITMLVSVLFAIAGMRGVMVDVNVCENDSEKNLDACCQWVQPGLNKFWFLQGNKAFHPPISGM